MGAALKLVLPAEDHRQAELAKLIRQQRRDDAEVRIVHPNGRFVQESQLGTSPDGTAFSLADMVADPAPEPVVQVAEAEARRRRPRPIDLAGLASPSMLYGLIGLGLVWSPAVIDYTTDRPCPACSGGEKDRNAVCLVCSASGQDPTRKPMKDEHAARQAAGWDGDELAGGTGKVPFRKPKIRQSQTPRNETMKRGRR